MELINQESKLLQEFVSQMDQTATATDDDQEVDQTLVRLFKEFIGNRDYAAMIDTLTTLATYYIENEILLILIIPDESVSDRTVERLFYDTIDEIDEQKRMKILEDLSVHRYVLFESIANKASILEQLSTFIDSLMIEPGTA